MIRSRIARGTRSDLSSANVDELPTTTGYKKRRRVRGGILSCKVLAYVSLVCFFFLLSVEVGFLLSLRYGSRVTHEDRLPRTQQSTSGLDPPIDNYYSRKHIREAVPLIVGGSDGSGTRAFVTILEALNVPILVEDRGTMDVHGKEIYRGAGWPTLVSKVLNATHSADYDLEDLPSELRDEVMEQIEYFVESMQRAGRSMVRAEIDPNHWATNVLWGIKAPVSILLLPLFRQSLPAMKVLHIVRDGRDVALSDNHSPVRKFYTDFYKDAIARHRVLMNQADDFGKESRTHIKAMQLWQDWNRQVYDYGMRYSDGTTLDVVVMRTEDLIRRPFESISLLADFVGSPKTPQDICCLSRKSANDLGQSGGNPWADLTEAGETDTDGIPHHHMVDVRHFSQIKRRFEEFADTPHQPKVDIKSNQRRLTQKIDVEEDDDTNGLFQSAGRIASANAPNVNHRPNMGEVSAMQKVLEERRQIMKTPDKPQSHAQVKQRYGKWKKALESDPLLSNRLHLEGSDALALFGYEPSRQFMDRNPDQGFVCDASIECPV